MSDVERIRAFINAHRGMNEGGGIVVPPALAERLAEMGVTEGYTVQRYIPTK